jgi:hypothetical protein
MRPRSVFVAAAIALSACGVDKAGGSASPVAAAPKSDDAGAQAAAAPPKHPFAGSAAEAAQLIGDAIDKKSPDVQKCVAEYRTRKKLPHERVTISMGVGQDGRLLGATLPKGQTDAVLSDCVQKALADAPFPSSHSGVISITKSYEEIIQ